MGYVYKSLALGLLIGAGLSTAAMADLSEKHVKIALQSVKFIEPKVESGQFAAFVYKDGDAASKALADGLAAGMKSDVLTAKVVPSSGGDLTGSRLIFLTDAAVADVAGLESAAASNKAALVAAQTGCSESGDCVISVETDPKVQIYLSTAAAGKYGVSFSNAFMMLVKKH